MQKKGFVFLESIIAIVFLMSSLLLLYSTFKRVLQNTKNIYYDDVNYIYRTQYIKDLLYKVDNLNYLNENNLSYIKINKNNYNKEINDILNDFEVKDIVLFKKEKLFELKNCLYKNNCSIEITNNFQNYLKKINVELESDIIIAIEYQTCQNSCYNYYSWVSV